MIESKRRLNFTSKNMLLLPTPFPFAQPQIEYKPKPKNLLKKPELNPTRSKFTRKLKDPNPKKNVI